MGQSAQINKDSLGHLNGIRVCNSETPACCLAVFQWKCSPSEGASSRPEHHSLHSRCRVSLAGMWRWGRQVSTWPSGQDAEGFYFLRLLPDKGDQTARFKIYYSGISFICSCSCFDSRLILLSSCCLILETDHVKLSSNKTPKTSGHNGFTISNNPFCWCICYAILWRAKTQIFLAPYLYKYIINYLVVTKVNWKIFVKKLISIFYLIF